MFLLNIASKHKIKQNPPIIMMHKLLNWQQASLVLKVFLLISYLKIDKMSHLILPIKMNERKYRTNKKGHASPLTKNCI